MISELFVKCQFGAMYTASGLTDGKVTNRGLCSAESEIFGRIRDIPLIIPAPECVPQNAALFPDE